MTPARRLWFEHAWIAGGWADAVALDIDIENGRIARVETGAPSGGAARGFAALPGLANLHSHTFQRAMAGLTQVRGPADDDFWTWREWMYRFLDRLTPDDVEAIAAQAFMEMLEGGFTRVGEFHYLHHDPAGRPYARLAETAERIVCAAERTGIGLTLLPSYYAQGGFGGAAPTAGQRRFLNDPDRFARLLEESRAACRALPDAVVGVAPHSLRAVSPEDLARVVELGSGGPIHIHAAEQAKEVTDCLAWSGARPVRWLLDHAPVGPGWCLIHATHIDDDETAALAASGAVAGLCPTTEADLGDGVFPAASYSRAEGRIGVGSDSNARIDPAEELRLMEYVQRGAHRGRNLLASPRSPSTGETLFARTLAGGAQALGGAEGLVAGASADLFSLSLRSDALAGRPRGSLIDGWLFAGRGVEIDGVWRRGEPVVAGGRHGGREAISAAFQDVMRRLLA